MEMAMSNRTSLMGAIALALLLGGCGRGEDDPLVDGAVDRTRDGNSRAAAEDVGPPSPSSAAAGPAAARTGADQANAGTAAPPGAGSPAGSGPMLRISQGPHGAHLVDSGGIALYVLEGDRMGEKCVGECLNAWPPVLAGAVQPTAEAGLQGAMVATIARPDGSRQVTYNRQPLYRYAGDGGAGSTNGHALKDEHGTWYLVSPQGARVEHAGAAKAGG
jgi:predicted lipoprotein with Yx(FWY)xxD motif